MNNKYYTRMGQVEIFGYKRSHGCVDITFKGKEGQFFVLRLAMSKLNRGTWDNVHDCMNVFVHEPANRAGMMRYWSSIGIVYQVFTKPEVDSMTLRYVLSF